MTTPSLNRHRVLRRRDFNDSIFELALERGDATFTPGENLTIFNADQTVSRPYSIASGTAETELRFLIRRLPGGIVSNYLGSLKPGDEVATTPPFGWFRPGEDPAAPCVFLATGTGIAPFLSSLRSPGTTPPHLLLYGVRHRSDAAYVAELRRLAPDCRLFVSRETAADAHPGHLTAALPTIAWPDDARFYLCGLDAMIDDATDVLEANGIPFANIHREVFFHAAT